MSKSIYPSIPAPGNDMPSLQATLGAMRQSLNMLILNAQNPNPNFSPSTASQIFVTHAQLRSLNLVGEAGPQGAKGDQGLPGPAGAPGGPTVIEPPNDGKIYGRRNSAWIDITAEQAHFARVRASTTLNTAVANGGVLQYDLIDDDTDGFIVGAPPFSGLTIPAGLAGVYMINGWSSGSGNQSTTLGMGIYINATPLTGTNQSISGPGSVSYTLDNAAVSIHRLVAGDVVEMFNTSVSGGTNIFTSVFLSLARLGA